MLTRGQRSTDTIQVARHLCNGSFHQFGCGGVLAHRCPRPFASAFPDFVASQSHVGPNLSSCLIDIPIPPNKPVSCTRHNWHHRMRQFAAAISNHSCSAPADRHTASPTSSEVHISSAGALSWRVSRLSSTVRCFLPHISKGTCD